MNITDAVTSLPLVGPSYTKKLEILGIYTVNDLLLHIPRRYNDFRDTRAIADITIDEEITIKGTITAALNQYTKKGKQMQIVKVEDETGSIEAIWFNQKYLLSTLKKGSNVVFSGKASWFGRKKALISPEYELLKDDNKTLHTSRLVAHYPETAGISSKWLRSRIDAALKSIKNSITEPYSEHILTSYSLIPLIEALQEIHFPETIDEIAEAKHRLAFDELLALHLQSLTRKKERSESHEAHSLEIRDKDVKKFITHLPFDLTASQKRSIEEIKMDLHKSTPMSRLLEGDVGSGKTVVAAFGCYVSFLNGHQSVVMAPTQILANQHFESLQRLLQPFGINISLITSQGIRKTSTRSDIIVGTHALIHKHAQFDNVAFVVIDEQHRFGVSERDELVTRTKKGRFIPDVLTMTATPIPRTVALTLYGDLDLSTLDSLPKGRQSITTWLVPNEKRIGAYHWIDSQIKKDGIQVYVVCPFIDESESENLTQVKAVKTQYDEIKKMFPKRRIGLLHGKMKNKEKDGVLDAFRSGKIDILVSTPVIEVGIDIPNATIMLIEGAERFGLAALHQLRGRVGRGEKKSYCLLFTESLEDHVISRLEAIKKARTGFELAEIDLQLRGPGEIFGTKQSGFPELKIASWTDAKLIKQTKELAEKLIEGTNTPLQIQS